MPPLSRGFQRLCVAHNLSVPRFRVFKRFQSTQRLGSRNDFFKISEEVQEALETGRPVVALETTIYTHGFPYPENIALSSHLESLVRVNGGIPATIGVLNGVARVGMEAEELTELVSGAGSSNTWKISRRDLGFISGLGLTGRKFNGGTTIAGTMMLAHLAGIKIFATGGLGGVHRGGENSMDISADLTELGRTPVTVISSGCKSFLDIPRTLEYLETQGVGIGTFADGREGPVDFPAFFSRDSGVRSPKVIQDEAEAAAIVFAQSRFPLQSGLHFANPVPSKAAMSREDIDAIIEDALRLADSKGIHGAENTPFVLNQIKELSSGRSVIANRALIEANVIRGTKVAVELAKLELQEKGVLERSSSSSVQVRTSSTSTAAKAADKSGGPTPLIPMSANQQGGEIASSSLTVNPTGHVDILVFGSLASDLICDYNPLVHSRDSTSPAPYTSNPAIITQSAGGVGYNVALAAKYAGASVWVPPMTSESRIVAQVLGEIKGLRTWLLSSIVADDLAGRSLLDQLTKSGLSTEGVQNVKQADGFRTAQYIAVNDKKKDLVMAMADMAILQDSSLDMLDTWKSLISLRKPKWIVVDGNWSATLLSQIISIANKEKIKVAFEPVSVQKSVRIFQPDQQIVKLDGVVPRHRISLATPNIFELEIMYQTTRKMGFFESREWWEVINSFEMFSAGSRDRLVSITNVKLVDRGIPQQTIQLLPYIPNLVVKLGEQGCLLAYLLPRGDPSLSSPEAAPYILGRATSAQSVIGGVYMRLFPPTEVVPQEAIVNVNGVGDAMLGVLMAGLAKSEVSGVVDVVPQRTSLTTVGASGGELSSWPARLEELIPMAQQAAVLTLKSAAAVSPEVQTLRDSVGRL